VHPHLTLLAVGPGTDFSQQLLSRFEGMAGLVVLGAVSDDVRTAAINACDFLVLPSRGEAFGIVFLESWVLGKPVIGAQTRSVSSVIEDGRDGLLIPPGDVKALMTALAHLVENPDSARQMGAAGRTKVLARYTTARVTDVVEAAYLRVLRRRWRGANRAHTADAGRRFPSAGAGGLPAGDLSDCNDRRVNSTARVAVDGS
jgi:glycosyltransferase involved in cell wall biosynthesis